MCDKAIKRTSMLIGAGALADLNNTLLSDNNTTKGVCTENITEELRKDLQLNEIAKLLDEYHKKDGKKTNFEEMLHLLEIASSYSNQNGTMPISSVIIGLKNNVVFDANNLIVQREKLIKNIYDTVSPFATAIYWWLQHKPRDVIWYNFWENINCNNMLDIFNLNYDYTIENILKDKYINGFKNTHNGHYVFEPTTITNTEQTRLMHLHGCITYGYTRQPFTYNDSHNGSSDVFHDTLLDLVDYGPFGEKEAIDTLVFGNAQFTQAGEELMRCPIITGLNKTNKILYFPFSTYYSIFNNAIITNERLIIVGYSFGDDHINRLLQEHSWLHRDNRKIILIDCFGNKKNDERTRFIVRASRDKMFFKKNDIDKNEILISDDKRFMLFTRGYKSAIQSHQQEILEFIAG